MKRFVVALLAVTLAVPAVAADDVPARIFATVLKEAEGTLRSHGHWPAVVSNATDGGTNRFVADWLHKRRGQVIAEELSADFNARNEASALLPASPNVNIPVVDLTEYAAGGSYDWEKLERAYPGIKAIVRWSNAGIDRLGSNAVIRMDVIPRNASAQNPAVSQFFDLERQRDSSWKITIMAYTRYDAVRQR